jgi:flagellin-like hook-associated protein FlgL
MQVARGTLEKLDSITDKLIGLATEASRSGSGEQQRREYDLRFKRLGKEFRSAIEESEVNGNNIVTADGLKAILVNIGLDPDKSESIASFFDDFVTVGETSDLASEEAKGNRPANIPASAYRANQAKLTRDYDSIFASDRSITNRPDAFLMVEDLKGLKRQIDKNNKVLEDGIGVIAQNIELVRATGLALLEVEGQITGAEEADDVARRVRDLIRLDAGAALAQAENLEPLAVAALAFGR